MANLTVPAGLPIAARAGDIAAALRDHQVVVVAGETGSGKTTQLPKISLTLGRGQEALIGHTQPRRLAARSVAERIASETGTELGDLVGYQVRFNDRTTATTRVKVMTDGILLAELPHDRMLRRYDTLIIDEAHERSLNIDFVLGYLKQLLPRRPDLKVVVTSATIDTARFAAYFDDAPVIEVSGRSYPVELRYRPLVDSSYDEEGEPVVRDQADAVDAAVAELAREGPGDILVFLPGEREIRDTAASLAAQAEGPRGFDIVPLFARLAAAEQYRVFATHTRRRVVLATNIAETSLTVPGIRYVVDTGLARVSRFSLRTKVQRLPVEPVSQASANQRAGRCGRVAPGICIRLYDEEDYQARPEFTDPEILRTNLASVILQMTALGLGDVERFAFLDAPDPRHIRAGVQLLQELGALRSGLPARLTGIGRRLARLPIEPRLGRMVIEADRLGVLPEVLVVAAALSVQDPRERPVEHQARADQLHARFRDPTSDFVAWLNLWRYVRGRQRELGSSAFRRLCRDEHLNHLRVREWQDYVGQLRDVAKQLGLRPGRLDETAEAAVDRDGLHQALLSGLLSHIGLRDAETRDYLGARGTRFAIFPGSGLARRPPELVMAAELVETSRLWARQVAGIDPGWAERLGEDLVSRTYAEPHWSKKRAATVALERVTLYGVPLVADRRVDYGRIDPELARELFIRHALVQREWAGRHAFLETNARLLEDAEELEHRARRHDIVVDDETLFDFYDARIPPEVVSGAHFDSWWKQARRGNPELLTFDAAMLIRESATEGLGESFPQRWHEGDLELPIDYHFEPGAEDDGLTVDVPLATLNRVDPAGFSWSVPGLREELVTALIRGLPKRLRVSFVPAPNTAREFLATVPPGAEPLTRALSRYLLGRTGIPVPPEAWDLDGLPAHLRPRFRVVDEDGGIVGEGRDLADLVAAVRPSFEAAMAQVTADSGLSATNAHSWVFGAVPETVSEHRAGHEVVAYPAVVDEGRSVGVALLGSPDRAEAEHRRGLRRLLALTLPDPTRALLNELDNADRLGLAGSPYAGTSELLADVRLAALGEAVAEEPDVRDEASFDSLRARAEAADPDRTRRVLRDVLVVLGRWRTADRALRGSVPMPLLASMADIWAQLGRLVRPGFVADAGAQALRHYPRYLDALVVRREALSSQPARDADRMVQVAPFQQVWDQQMAALEPGAAPPLALLRLRWLLEEFRVSLWAERLGTAEPVSVKRLRRAVEDLR